jgi:hypothetical protein
MSVLKDVADAIKDVSEGIEHIRTVAKAVSDGVDYLKVRHPDIKKDLAAMCEEMRNTSIGVAAASSILTHFRFTISGTALDSEPGRFNEHLIAHKEKAAKVEASLHKLRGHCHVIDLHLEQLRRRKDSLNLGKLLLLLGINSDKREEEVLQALRNISDEEHQGYLLVTRLSHALREALDEIGKALGPSGSALPQNVPSAAKLLGEYATEFNALETQANYIALELQQSIDILK